MKQMKHSMMWIVALVVVASVTLSSAVPAATIRDADAEGAVLSGCSFATNEGSMKFLYNGNCNSIAKQYACSNIRSPDSWQVSAMAGYAHHGAEVCKAEFGEDYVYSFPSTAHAMSYLSNLSPAKGVWVNTFNYDECDAMYNLHYNSIHLQQQTITGAQIVNRLLIKNSEARRQIEKSWVGSFLGRDLYQERGGWIFANPDYIQDIKVVLAPSSASKTFRGGDVTNPAINLEDVGKANVPYGYVLVGNFHTHPLDRNQEPSTADLRNAIERGVPGIVISRNRIYTYGPSERTNFYVNPQGYPDDGDVSHFNPNCRRSVVAVAVNPFPVVAVYQLIF